MPNYKFNDRVVLTKGETKIVGTLAWVGETYADVKPDDVSQAVSIKLTDWQVELVAPRNSDILAALKPGSVFHYNNENTKYVVRGYGGDRTYMNTSRSTTTSFKPDLFDSYSWTLHIDYEA